RSRFRGFTLLAHGAPADVGSLIGAALDAGAEPVKPAATPLWEHGGVVRSADGTVWQMATSAKKNTGPATRRTAYSPRFADRKTPPNAEGEAEQTRLPLHSLRCFTVCGAQPQTPSSTSLNAWH